MQTSDMMRKMIEDWEGLRLKSYQDVVGVLTVGFGHTGPDVHPGMVISQATADTLLASDLRRFETAVAGMAHTPTQGQFDAMVSFAYNLGEGALKGSTLLRQHNAGNFAAAGDEFLRWDHAGGQKLPGLTKRRQGEREVYLGAVAAKPAPPATPLPVPSPAELQTALAQHGFDPGPIDAIWGDRSAAALAAYFKSLF